MVKATQKRDSVRRKAALPASKRICVMVLGMHRSGTSALTRVFSLLGCDLPQTLIGANRTNEPGHWEAEPVARLNDQLLESAGTTWDDWAEVNPDWFASPRSEEFREKAVEVLAAEFGASRIFVLKDPRICRLAPFWLDVLEHVGIQPIIVVPLRNPRDVAMSLKARNDFEPGFSNLLWLRHVLDAERATRGLPRCLTGYDDLLANWARVVDHVRSRTGIAWPRYSAQSAAEIDSFLSDRFRHHHEGPATVIENPSLSRWLRESYAILLDWVQSGERAEDYERLDAIRKELNVASPAFGRLIASGQEDRKTIGRLKKEGAEQKAKLDTAGEAVARLEAREKELGAKIEGLRTRLAEERAALERAIAEVHSNLNARTAQLDAARGEIKELAGRLSHTESALAQRSLEAEQTAAELAKVRGQLEQRAAELEETLRARSELEKALEAARRSAEQAAAEATEVRNQLENRSKDLDSALRIRSELEQSLTQSRRAAEQAAAAVFEVRDRLEARERGLSEAMQAKTELEQSLLQSRRGAEQATAAMGEIRNRLEARERDLVAAVEAKSELEQSLTDSRRAAEQAAAAAVEERGRLEARERDLQAAMQAKAELEKSLSETRRTAEHLAAEVIEVRGRLEDRERGLDGAMRAISELEHDRSRIRHEAERTAAEFIETRDRLEQQAQELLAAHRQRAELEELVASARQHSDRIGAEMVETLQRLERREHELLETRRAALAMEHERETARKNIEALDRLVAEKEKVTSGLRDHIFVLKADFEREHAATASLEAERDEAMNAVAARVEEIERLKAEANKAKAKHHAEMQRIKAETENAIADGAAELHKLKIERDRAVADRASAERRLRDRFDEIAALTRALQEKERREARGSGPESGESEKAIPGVPGSGFTRLLPARLRVRFQIQQLRKSGIFDPEWYVGYYEDIAKAGVDPYWHFIMHGAAEGRSPNAKWERGER